MQQTFSKFKMSNWLKTVLDLQLTTRAWNVCKQLTGNPRLNETGFGYMWWGRILSWWLRSRYTSRYSWAPLNAQLGLYNQSPGKYYSTTLLWSFPGILVSFWFNSCFGRFFPVNKTVGSLHLWVGKHFLADVCAYMPNTIRELFSMYLGYLGSPTLNIRSEAKPAGVWLKGMACPV